MENWQWEVCPDLATLMAATQTPYPCPITNARGWEETTVNMLINEENWTWNEHLIDGLFVPEEVELVKKIRLSIHSVDDKMFWPWTQSGAYTCKSGYWFLKMEDEEEGREDV